MKLPNGFGSVYKLSGNRRNPYVAKKTKGWEIDPKTGKSKQLYTTVGYYPTRKEALTALAEYNKDPFDLHHATITFEEVYEKWSEIHFEKIKDTNGYKAAFNTSKDLWKMRFVDIKLDHLQSVVDNSGKNTPTLKTLKILWGLMYDYAVIHEIVSQDKRDMVRYVDISKAGNPNAYNRKPFSKKEISILWKCKDSNIYVTVILIMIYSGVRIGELLDLEKKDIHLDERWFYVKESKTEAGIREVPIAEKIVPFFEYWMNRKCDHLICTPDDEPFQYRNYYDSYWIPLMLEFGFGKFVIDETKKNLSMTDTAHMIQDTPASLLTEKEVDERFIKKIVGHKGQGVTENVYTHIELPTKLEAINLI